MAIDFPSPANPGDTYVYGDVTYTFDGVKWTALAVDRFVNIDGDTMTGNLTVPSLNDGPLAGFRNAIINGNFDVWQRGTSSSAGGYQTADRWRSTRTISTLAVSQQPFTLGQTAVPGEPTYYISSVVTSAAGAGNRASIEQKIESVRTFAGQEVTVSFWAKADATKPMAVELRQYFGTGGTPSSDLTASAVKVTLTTSWQKFSLTATLPSISGKTLGSDNNDAVWLTFWFDAGSNFNSQTDSLGQQSGTFDIAQVQVEAGPIATPFERRPIGTEELLCYRYYYVAAGGNEAGANSSSFWAGSTTGAWFAGVYNHKVTMRNRPTVIFPDTPTYINCSNLVATNEGPNYTRFTVVPTAAGRYTVSWSKTYLDAEL